MKLVILGAGANARETLDVLDARRRAGEDLELIGFLVDPPYAQPGDPAHGSRVLGSVDWLAGRPLDGLVGFCAVGAPAVRRRLVDRATALGLRFTSLVHPSVPSEDLAQVGAGTLVQKGTLATRGVRLGSFVHVYAGCILSHDVQVGDHATVCPGVKLAGAVTVGEGAVLGIGATVTQRRTVGAWSVVGAGATVIRDVPADATVAGVPAQVIGRRPAGWHLDPGAKSPF